MAKTNEQFDQHFREKLDEHREKPSALAWERLESQLLKDSKPTFGIWWAIAASVTALLVAGYSFWPTDDKVSKETFVAEKTELPQENQMETILETPLNSSKINESVDLAKTTENPDIKTEVAQTKPAPKPITTEKTKPTPPPASTQIPKNLVAQAESETIKSPMVVAIPELKTDEVLVTLPELKAPKIDKTVTQTTSAEAEPAYRVSIYSNGVKKGEPQDKNLITELGKTIGQVEGLLSKVDDGLISLQDKKDNLFASLTSKKSQTDEKP
jgi:hypothetical protein